MNTNATGIIAKRREPRLASKLQVRVLGIDDDGKTFHQVATTLDVSLTGARITGVVAKLSQGNIIGMRNGDKKSMFKVAWVKGNRDNTYEMGLQCIEKDGCPWHYEMQRLKEGERRRDERYPCDGSALLTSESLTTPIVGTLSNVSKHGCGVLCNEVAANGETLSGQFIVDETRIDAVVEVRHSLPAVGMGLRWCDLGSDGEEKLNHILYGHAFDSSSAISARKNALEQWKKLHQLVAALGERLMSESVLVPAGTTAHLIGAKESLKTALKGMEL